MATIRHKDATLLVDGTIIAGVIFDNDRFQAGTRMGAQFMPDRMNKLTGAREKLTVDVSGLDIETVDDGWKPQQVVRITRADATARMVQ